MPVGSGDDGHPGNRHGTDRAAGVGVPAMGVDSGENLFGRGHGVSPLSEGNLQPRLERQPPLAYHRRFRGRSLLFASS